MNKIHRFKSLGLVAALIALLLPLTTNAAGYLEKSFSCKVETEVEAIVIDDDQEGVEFLIDDCFCSETASGIAELAQLTCHDQASKAVKNGWNLAQAESHIAKIPWQLEGAWDRYKLPLRTRASVVNKTVYCLTTDQISKYMTTCLRSALEGSP